MKQKTKSIALALIMLILSTEIAAQAEVNNLAGLTVAVKLVRDIDSDELADTKAVAIEVVNDVYSGNQKIFAQGQQGYAMLNHSRGGAFGRGGEISINQGQLTDLNGVNHNLSMNLSSHGDRRLSSAAGTLIGSALTYGILSTAIQSRSVTGIIYGAGTAIGTAGYAMRKGNHVRISSGTVVLATIAS